MSADTTGKPLQDALWAHDLTQLMTWYRVGIIVALGLVAWLAIRWITSRLRRLLTRVDADVEHQRRLITLARLVRYALGVALFLIVLLLVLSELGISIAPLLGAAGIAGIAIGLAAQNIVKDFLRGTAILLENQLRVGDEVEVADKRGTVEEVTLGFVMLREPDGTVHFVRTGDIGTVTNHTYGRSRRRTTTATGGLP